MVKNSKAIIDNISKFDKQIDVLKKEIEILKDKKKMYKAENEHVFIKEKIEQYEKRYPEQSARNIKTLVLTNENFDQWYERVGNKCAGASIKSSRTTWIDECKKMYANGGLITNGCYIKWLIKIRDPRLNPYKIGR